MEELIDKAMLGDKNAFSLIFLQLQGDLYRIAFSKTGNKEDSLDAIQETMIITYKNMNNLNSKSSIKYWIIKVLINECYKILNKKNKTNIISMQNYEFYENVQSDNLSSINELESSIEFRELLQCLNDKEKVIMILYYENSYTTKEISNIMKIKENTIKSIIKRSKEKIKNNLKGDSYEKLYG